MAQKVRSASEIDRYRINIPPLPTEHTIDPGLKEYILDIDRVLLGVVPTKGGEE
jgi:hypothetical protein